LLAFEVEEAMRAFRLARQILAVAFLIVGVMFLYTLVVRGIELRSSFLRHSPSKEDLIIPMQIWTFALALWILLALCCHGALTVFGFGVGRWRAARPMPLAVSRIFAYGALGALSGAIVVAGYAWLFWHDDDWFVIAILCLLAITILSLLYRSIRFRRTSQRALRWFRESLFAISLVSLLGLCAVVVNGRFLYGLVAGSRQGVLLHIHAGLTLIALVCPVLMAFVPSAIGALGIWARDAARFAYVLTTTTLAALVGSMVVGAYVYGTSNNTELLGNTWNCLVAVLILSAFVYCIRHSQMASDGSDAAYKSGLRLIIVVTLLVLFFFTAYGFSVRAERERSQYGLQHFMAPGGGSAPPSKFAGAVRPRALEFT
jgi:hypothetical protein